MRVVAIDRPGGPEVLTPTSAPIPEPAPGELRVRVVAAGVNRPDVLQRLGRYPVPADASPLPGLEVSGVVDALGAGVAGFAVGDRVCALVNGGGYAEYAVAPAGQVLPIPGSLSFVEAAAIPETFFTVWVNVFEHGRLAAGETLLVHGGSSGIGTAAIALAKALGASVFVTAGSSEKCRACLELGADGAVCYRDEGFFTALRELTGGVDVVLDMVGGDYVPRNLELLNERGRHVSIAFLRGPITELNLLMVMQKRLVLTGSTLRPRSLDEKRAIAVALRETVWPLFAEGRLQPVIDGTFALAEASAAHRRMESSEHVGKLVLLVADGP